MKLVKISFLSLGLMVAGAFMAHATKIQGQFVPTGSGNGWISWHCEGTSGWCMKKSGGGGINPGDEVILNHRGSDGKLIKVTIVAVPSTRDDSGGPGNSDDPNDPSNNYTGQITGSVTEVE